MKGATLYAKGLHMSNYNDSTLIEGLMVNPDTGEILTTQISGKRIRARGGREVYMRRDGEYERFLISLSSSLETSIGLALLRDIDRNGILRYPIKHYEKEYNTTRKTVSAVIRKALNAGMILKAGRRVYVNPYAVLPYNIKDLQAGKLQQQWTLLQTAAKNGTLTKLKALEIAEAVFGNEVYGSV